MAPGTRPLLFFMILGTLGALSASGCGRNRADEAEIDRILEQIRAEDRVESTSAAISTQHLVRRQSRFSLLDRTELRWWQERLRPAVPALVEMLADERGLEWIDSNGNTEQVTTPRKEARLTLAALGRASVEGLIGALDRPELARKADESLREIIGGGPAAKDRASWQRFWEERRGDGLPDEQGRLLEALLGLLALGGLILGFITLQRRHQRAQEGKRLRLSPASPSGPAPAAAPLPPAPAGGDEPPPAQNLKT